MSKKQWPLALKIEYFEYCETLPPSYLLNLHSTAILHLKQILHPSPSTLLNRLSSILYKPPTMSLSLLSDPVELIKKQHLLPTNFYCINRFDIKSTPRMGLPSVRLIYKETPKLLEKLCLTRNLKDNCLEDHCLFDDTFIRIVLGKSIPRKISTLRQRVIGEKRLVSKSPLGMSLDVVERRDSKFDDAFGLIKSKSFMSLKIKSQNEGKRNSFNGDGSDRLVMNLKDKQKGESFKITSSSSMNGLSGVWRSVSSVMSKLVYNE